MASPQKQAKRAQRAKAKAKQGRTVRNNTLKDAELEYQELAPSTLEMFKRMKQAEETSRVEMLVILLSDPGLAIAGNPQDATDMQRILMALYRDWRNDRGHEIPGAWANDPSFKEDYAKAAHIIGRPEFIEAWDVVDDI